MTKVLLAGIKHEQILLLKDKRPLNNLENEYF